MIVREIDFICRIEILEDINIIDEVANEVCMNFQNIMNEIIIRRKLDATIKKVKLSSINKRR